MPPVDFASLNSSDSGAWVRHDVPLDAVEVCHLGAGGTVGRDLVAGDIPGVALVHEPCTWYSLVWLEAIRAAAHNLGDLFEGVGRCQSFRHDRAHARVH